MPRIPRLLIENEPTVYHVMTRTALPEFPLDSLEKDYLFNLIKHFSNIYFTEVLGFCLMGNHIHIVVRMHVGDEFSDDEIKKRFVLCYGDEKVIGDKQIPFYREKWGSLSSYMKEIKQTFTRYYNKIHGRRGYFWGDRFKSVIVEHGETLINLLAYVDLNPVRAGIVDHPEGYRWCSLGYHVQTGNKENFLSLDYGLVEFGERNETERMRLYRKFVYETGAIDLDKGRQIKENIVQKERDKDYKVTRTDRFKGRTRYFCDSGIIGTREFVRAGFQHFKHYFSTAKDRSPIRVSGFDRIYALKRLTE